MERAGSSAESLRYAEYVASSGGGGGGSARGPDINYGLVSVGGCRRKREPAYGLKRDSCRSLLSMRSRVSEAAWRLRVGAGQRAGRALSLAHAQRASFLFQWNLGAEPK